MTSVKHSESNDIMHLVLTTTLQAAAFCCFVNAQSDSRSKHQLCELFTWKCNEWCQSSLLMQLSARMDMHTYRMR